MAENKIFAGPRIRRIRNSLGLTQTAMAEALGISPSYLNLIERNQRPVSARVFVAGDAGDEDLQEALEEYRPRLHRAIGRQARLRRVPPLVFVIDDTARSAGRIEAILRDLGSGDD